MSLQFQHIAPAGGFPAPQAVLTAWNELLGAKQAATEYFTGRLTSSFKLNSVIHYYRSGREALYRVFLALRAQDSSRGTVAMSAYTCPDIAAAAVRAGMKLQLLDVNPRTLQISPDDQKLDSTVCAVVLSNLYGLPDELEGWLSLTRKQNMLLIDDACQAALSARNGVHVGADSRVIGIFSFGRGKAICGVGGGALIIPRDHALASRVSRQDIGTSMLSSLKSLFSGALAHGFERPHLYAIPASLPMLGLGETAYKQTFPLGALSLGQAAVALAAVASLEDACQVRVENARLWHEGLSAVGVTEPYIERGLSFDGSVVPIRYPILLAEPALKATHFKSLQPFGVSQSYPTALTGFPALSCNVLQGHTPHAEDIAKRLLTLPVHRYVTEKVRQAVIEILSQRDR